MLAPDDMPMAILYDHFTPYVLMQLEELGFCGRGEAKDFIADGAIEVGGRLPLNTHGGQLGEAYIHGMNGIAEAVRATRVKAMRFPSGDQLGAEPSTPESRGRCPVPWIRTVMVHELVGAVRELPRKDQTPAVR